MYIPAPDALLIAQHVKEWPAHLDRTQGLYLYKALNDPDQAQELGLFGLGGIGQYGVDVRFADTDHPPRMLVMFDKVQMVKLHMVFVVDKTHAPCLGRDVLKAEWCRAREYLAWHAEQQGEENGSATSSDS